jgi:hypothetical protein
MNLHYCCSHEVSLFLVGAHRSMLKYHFLANGFKITDFLRFSNRVYILQGIVGCVKSQVTRIRRRRVTYTVCWTACVSVSEIDYTQYILNLVVPTKQSALLTNGLPHTAE